MFSKFSFLQNKPADSFQTKIDVLDELTGGLPVGKVVEFVGGYRADVTNLIFDIMDKVDDDVIVAYVSTIGTENSFIIERDLCSKENFVLLMKNEEEDILDFIKNTVNNVDLFIIDSMHNILTENEKGGFKMAEYQDIPGLLQKLTGIMHGTKSSLIAVNILKTNLETGAIVPRWNNMFQRYCSLRIRIHEYSNENIDIEVLSHKLNPRLAGGRKNELRLGQIRL